MFEDLSERPGGLQSLGARHGVSLEAVRHLLHALEAGHGTMAQFDHPELGGFGQWFSGGMTMIGRMGDDALKARVGALCADLAASLPSGGFREAGSRAGGGAWWPDGLGSPSSVGAQNATRYAYFAGSRRLAIESGGRVRLYDTGAHVITGAAQAQGLTGSLRFSGPDGAINLDDLRPLDDPDSPGRAAPSPAAAADGAASAGDAAGTQAPSAGGASDILGTLERLADLHARGILTDAEFGAKKADLLARL